MLALFGVLLLGAMSASAEVVPGEPITAPVFKNAVPDPGCEQLLGQPAKDTWNYYLADKWVVDTTVFHGGKQSVRLDATDKTKTCGAATGAPGSTEAPVVEFGGWAKVKPTEGPAACPRFCLQVVLKGGRVLENTATFKQPPLDWQFVGNRVNVGDSQVDYVMIYCLTDGQTGSTWFDDVYIGMGRKPMTRGENLLTAGGFEEASKWHPYGEGFVLDAAAAHSGKAGLRLKADKPYRLYGARCVVKPVASMDAILIGGWCRSEQKGGRASITADVHYKDGSVLPCLSAIFPTAPHDWMKCEEQLNIIPGDIDYITVSAELLFAGAGEVCFDDLYLMPLKQ